MPDNKLKFGKKIKKVKFFFEQNFPRIAGNMMTQFTEKNFQRGGFEDTGFTKWPSRKPGSPRNKGRRILVDSGDLKRSATKKPRVRRRGRDIHIKQTSDLIYANVHNSGLRAGRGGGFIMPQRKFMGRSKKLEKKIERRAVRELDRIFK